MSDMHLEQAILDKVEDRLRDIDRLSVALRKKYPDFIAMDDDLGAQPCNTEFNTVGEGGSEGLTVAGIKAAYKQAQTDAQTICNTGECKTLKFVRYVEVSRTPNKRFRLVCAWTCGEGAF